MADVEQATARKDAMQNDARMYVQRLNGLLFGAVTEPDNMWKFVRGTPVFFSETDGEGGAPGKLYQAVGFFLTDEGTDIQLLGIPVRTGVDAAAPADYEIVKHTGIPELIEGIASQNEQLLDLVEAGVEAAADVMRNSEGELLEPWISGGVAVRLGGWDWGDMDVQTVVVNSADELARLVYPGQFISLQMGTRHNQRTVVQVPIDYDAKSLVGGDVVKGARIWVQDGVFVLKDASAAGVGKAQTMDVSLLDRRIVAIEAPPTYKTDKSTKNMPIHFAGTARMDSLGSKLAMTINNAFMDTILQVPVVFDAAAGDDAGVSVPMTVALNTRAPDYNLDVLFEGGAMLRDGTSTIKLTEVVSNRHTHDLEFLPLEDLAVASDVLLLGINTTPDLEERARNYNMWHIGFTKYYFSDQTVSKILRNVSTTLEPETDGAWFGFNILTSLAALSEFYGVNATDSGKSTWLALVGRDVDTTPPQTPAPQTPTSVRRTPAPARRAPAPAHLRAAPATGSATRVTLALQTDYFALERSNRNFKLAGRLRGSHTVLISSGSDENGFGGITTAVAYEANPTVGSPFYYAPDPHRTARLSALGHVFRYQWLVERAGWATLAPRPAPYHPLRFTTASVHNDAVETINYPGIVRPSGTIKIVVSAKTAAQYAAQYAAQSAVDTTLGLSHIVDYDFRTLKHGAMLPAYAVVHMETPLYRMRLQFVRTVPAPRPAGVSVQSDRADDNLFYVLAGVVTEFGRAG